MRRFYFFIKFRSPCGRQVHQKNFNEICNYLLFKSSIREKALAVTGNKGVEQAMEWLVSGMNLCQKTAM